MYACDPGWCENWCILDSGADHNIRTKPEGRCWQVNVDLGTAKDGSVINVKQMSTCTVPSPTIKGSIPLEALVNPLARRNINSVGEICDAGYVFIFDSLGACVYPSGSVPAISGVVAEAV